MAAKFSLGDLNDFLAPAQDCVNPLFVGTGTGDGSSASSSSSAPVPLSLEIDDEGDFVMAPSVMQAAAAERASAAAGKGLDSSGQLGFIEPNLLVGVGSTQKSGAIAARVSLNDCLACSGCVTSAETVLMKQQSLDRLMNALGERKALGSSSSYDLCVVSFGSLECKLFAAAAAAGGPYDRFSCLLPGSSPGSGSRSGSESPLHKLTHSHSSPGLPISRSPRLLLGTTAGHPLA